MPEIRITGAPVPPGALPPGGVFPYNLPQSQGVQAGAVAGGGFAPQPPVMAAHAAAVVESARAAAGGAWFPSRFMGQGAAAAPPGTAPAATGLMQSMMAQSAQNAARAAAAAGGAPGFIGPNVGGSVINAAAVVGSGLNAAPGFIGSNVGGRVINAAAIVGSGTSPPPPFTGGGGGWINGPPRLPGEASAPGFIGGGAAGGWINGPPVLPAAEGGGGGGGPWFPNRWINGAPGSGGGGGGGGGGWRRVLGAGVARAGLGRTGQFIGAGIAGGATAALVELGIDAVKDAIFFPQTYGGMARGALGNAQPFIDLSAITGGLGLAGGFEGGDLRDRLFPGAHVGQAYGRSPLLSSIGIGPGTAASLLQSFGIVPRGTESALSMVGALGTARWSPGFEGMPEAQVLSSVRNAAVYGGMGRPTGESIQNYLAQIGQVMEAAVARGMDRASVLRSIDASVARSAQAGSLASTPEAMAGFIGRFASLPGGRTGEVGADAATRVQGAADSYGANPIRTFNMASFAARFTSEKTFQDFVVSRGGNWRAMTDDPGKRRMIADMVLAAQRRNYAVAGALFGAVTTGQPYLQLPALDNPAIRAGGGPPEAGGLIGAAQTGLSVPQYYAYRYGGGMSSVSLGAGGFDPSKRMGYYQGLRAMGLSDELANYALAAAEKIGVDPIMLGAFTGPESRFGTDKHVGAYGMSGVENPWQVAGSSGLPRPGNAYQSAEEGAIVLRNAMRGGGATLTEMAERYHGPFASPEERAQYVSRLLAARAAAAQPAGVQGGVAAVGQAAMQGSRTSFAEMATFVPELNDAIHNVIEALSNLSTVVGRVPTTPSYMTGPGGLVQ